MKLSLQQQDLLEILKNGEWICTNSIDVTKTGRDFRKRKSELVGKGFIIKSETCGDKNHGHKAGVHKYRLESAPTRTIFDYVLEKQGECYVRVPRAVEVPMFV